MTTKILPIILFVIFSALGLMHFYWFLGGKLGLEKALPIKEIGEKAIEPPKIVPYTYRFTCLNI